MLISMLILAMFAIMFVIVEAAHASIIGWFIPEKELDLFFQKHLEQYKDGGVGRGIIYGTLSLPFIGQNPSFLSGLYISEIGSIPRWSKWNKPLRQILNNGQKKLSDY